jgi:hypothetical protein
MSTIDHLSFKTKMNVVGFATFLTLGAYTAYGLTRSGDADPCTSRYPAGTQMSLAKSGGVALSPAELQARVGIGERDMTAKASVVKIDQGPSPLALDVKIGGPLATDTGISFLWAPSGVSKAPAVCLSYRVFAPADFDFARGGELPGLIGGVTGRTAGRDVESGFSTKFTWDERGTVGLDVSTPTDRAGVVLVDPMKYRSERTILARGRWVEVEQELKLNDGASPDGVIRLWVDGRLVVKDTKVAWRPKGADGLSGVLADIGYRPVPMTVSTAAAIKVTTLRLSPMRLSWQ